MKKKKKNEESIEYHSPKAYQRTKKDHITVSGVLQSSGIKIKITAEPEDWKDIVCSYAIFSNKERFYQDVLPFIRAACDKALPKKILNESKQNVIEFLKIQAAVLYDSLSYISKLPDNQQPVLFLPSFKAIKEYKFTRCREKVVNPNLELFVQCLMNEVYSGWIGKRIKGWYDKKGFLNTDNFLKTYIQGGRNVMKTNIIKTRKRLQLMDIFLYGSLKEIKKETNPALDFLVTLSRAINLKYRTGVFPNSASTSIINIVEIDLIRRILKKLYPSLSFPLS